MSLNTMETRSESLPYPWETLGDFIERTLIGWDRSPVYKPKVPANRIGWLDSARLPSRIHATQDNGETTICQHFPKGCHEGGRWQIVESVPLRQYGRSRFCQVCFRHVSKSIPWVDLGILGNLSPGLQSV